MLKNILAAVFLIFSFGPAFAEEVLTITTYYPSPFGSYNELQSNKLAIGDTNPLVSGFDPTDMPPAEGQLYAARGVILKPQSALPAVGVIAGELVVYNNQLYLYNGSNFVNVAGWAVPSDIKATSGTHDGNFGGYRGMYNWIQQLAQGCAGYHVCDATEITRYMQNEGVMPATQGWYNSGIMKLVSGLAFEGDCRGWTSDGSSLPPDGGASWAILPLYRPTTAACNTSQPVLCCK